MHRERHAEVGLQALVDPAHAAAAAAGEDQTRDVVPVDHADVSLVRPRIADGFAV
jgi:hypothetical protein